MIKSCLILSNMYPSTESPAYGIFVKNMESHLASRGVNVDRAVISGKGRGVISKLTKYLSYSIVTAFKLLTRRYDVIYVHFVTLSTLPLLLCFPFTRGKVVFNAHGSDLTSSKILNKAVLSLTKPVINRADLLVVPSHYFASIARGFFDKVDIFVSPSGGINHTLFNESGRQSPIAGKIHIGFVSRIEPGKGWDILIQAINQLDPNILEKIDVVIVGDGSSRDEMLHMINECGLQETICCVGLIPQVELPDYYRSFDLFVFPTILTYESLGLVALEAISCGTPVIASGIGAVQDYLQDGVNGWCFPTENTQALALLISRYANLDVAERTAISLRCAPSVAVFESGLVADKLIEKLDSLLE